MKAAVLHGVGDLRYEEIENPELKPDEVKIKVHVCGICGSDTSRIFKKWKYPLPAILGHEFSGDVVEIGKDVTGFKIGDRVTGAPLIPCEECEFCKKGQFSLCEDHGMIGAKTFGAFAQYVNLKATNIFHIGDMDYEEAAMIEPLAVALHAILDMKPQIGDKVAVLGCGALGQYVIQWLKITGTAEVIAVDISEKKLNDVKKLGADVVINASEENVIDRIKELTDGRGVDIAVECAGSKITQEQCLLITKKRGHIGYLGIAYSDITLSETAFEGIFRKELTLKGYWNSYSAPFPGKEWLESIEYINQRRLKLKEMISHKFPLKDTMKAFEMIKKRKEEYNKVYIYPWEE